MSTTNVNDLFTQAMDAGAIPADSLATLQDLGAEIENAMGIDAGAVPASEVLLLTQEIDDSGSIRFSGNTQPVRDGHNMLLDELGKSNKGDDILAHTTYLNGGTLYPYTPLRAAKKLDSHNYNPAGNTPLYERTIVTLGAVLAKEQEFANQGVPVRTVTVIVTDGAATDTRHTAADVAKLVKSMLKAETHIIAFMGIDDGETDFAAVAREMGIDDQWILTPKNDGHSIREAFGLVSRVSKAASQTADSFQAAATTGFSAGIS